MNPLRDEWDYAAAQLDSLEYLIYQHVLPMPEETLKRYYAYIDEYGLAGLLGIQNSELDYGKYGAESNHVRRPAPKEREPEFVGDQVLKLTRARNSDFSSFMASRPTLIMQTIVPSDPTREVYIALGEESQDRPSEILNALPAIDRPYFKIYQPEYVYTRREIRSLIVALWLSTQNLLGLMRNVLYGDSIKALGIVNMELRQLHNIIQQERQYIKNGQATTVPLEEVEARMAKLRLMLIDADTNLQNHFNYWLRQVHRIGEQVDLMLRQVAKLRQLLESAGITALPRQSLLTEMSIFSKAPPSSQTRTKSSSYHHRGRRSSSQPKRRTMSSSQKRRHSAPGAIHTSHRLQSANYKKRSRTASRASSSSSSKRRLTQRL